jgi:ribonuclease Z
MTGRRISLVVLAAATLLAAVAYVNQASLGERVLRKLAERRLAYNPVARLQDGLHVGLCGAG